MAKKLKCFLCGLWRRDLKIVEAVPEHDFGFDGLAGMVSTPKTRSFLCKIRGDIRELNLCYYLNLTQHILWQSLYGNAASCGLGGKVISVDLVEGGKIVHVCKEAGCFYYL